MQLVHSQLPLPAKVQKPSKADRRRAEMTQALRRKQYQDFLSALKDPGVQKLVAEVQKLSPGWMPKFTK